MTKITFSNKMEVDIYSRREMMTNTLLEKVFKIEERKSSVKTEVIGGVTTFLAMAYIIFVNPAIFIFSWNG